MILSVVLAMSENRAIGIGGKLPWDLPEDLARFKQITLGHPIIMGRKTYESMGRPLPKRTNIVITRNPEAFRKNSKPPESVIVVESVEKALTPYRLTDEEVFIIGGGDIVKASLHLVDKMSLTHIHKKFDGDAFFPEFDKSLFREVWREDHTDGPLPFSYVNYERKK